MSIPKIPGYIGDVGSPRTLGAIWEAPDGNYPARLWPKARLGEMDPLPSGWLAIEEHFFTEEAHGGTGCILVPRDGVEPTLASTQWDGRDLGRVSQDEQLIVVILVG